MEKYIFIDMNNLAKFGEGTAKSFSIKGTIRGIEVSREIRQSLSLLKKIEDNISSPAPGSFSQWLNDNWYLARREGLSAVQAFRYSGRLQRAEEGSLIIKTAQILLHASDGEITASRLSLFLSGFQKNRPLPRREMYLFIPALKAAIISDLCLAQTEEISGENAARLFTSLRWLGSADLSELMESLDLTESALMKDPAGIYPGMSARTRDNYRRRVEQLAARQNIPEHILARRILRRAGEEQNEKNHVGFELFAKKQPSGLGYIAANMLITIFFALLAAFKIDIYAAALLILPISGAVRAVIDAILLRCISVSYVARMQLNKGVPAEGKTICVISALLTDAQCGKTLAARLEEFYLCNRDAGKNLLFGILADLPESSKKDIPGARDWLAQTERAIEGLNSKYSGGFMLLTRPRVLHEGKYMGFERKRGAILELARLIAAEEGSHIHCRAGDLSELQGTKYILTLDTDTRLTPGSACELIGAMLHPLNRPVIDEKRRLVVSGHGILQPRISTSLLSATKTPFSRLFAGQGGTDPYSSGSGEIYMDLTGASGFSGKGIIDAHAFLKCADRFPTSRVLSHDALEGACMRCGYVGDIELTDSFPGGVLSYYRRAHRWIRGDWQNSPWLLKPGKHFSDLDRWRIFDSLRRSLVPVGTLLALLNGFFTGNAIVALIALGCFVINLLITAVYSIITRPETGERYHSAVISGLPGVLNQSMVSLILLPFDAWVSLSAVFTALWRMTVTRRGLLDWQTAAQSEGSSSIFLHFSVMLPAAVLGAFCLLFSNTIIGLSTGFIWLVSPALAHSLSRTINSKNHRLNHRERCYLLTRAREMWCFFSDTFTDEDNYLPPDNWQDCPPIGIAHRTSPTNIGFALISTLTAADLGIIEPDVAAERISKTLSTVESVAKWNGHLYNWYNTSKLEVLTPRYVSTVDSGNLCACLIALSAGLREYGFTSLADRSDAIAGAMSFAPMYDSEKQLLRIGINVDSEHADPSCYDLLAGEARLTAFLAVSRGDVPKKLWARMGRSLVSKNRRRGMASWTGTMFEYLMPELLLPVTYSSLLYETHHFCLYAQKRRTGKLPWGTSESAYSALNPSLSYRYKAHGCQALALKPGMDTELVISPYSSFLALVIDPQGSVKNLMKIEEDYGMLGKYGFWEALDFTQSRMRTKQAELVRCIMAHHLGMSIIAIANCIQHGVWQRRFMQNRSMSAHSCMLEERIPINAPLLRRDPSPAETVARPDRSRGMWEASGVVTGSADIRCNVLTNGTYNVMSTSNGYTSSRCGDILMYAPPEGKYSRSRGLDFFVVMDGKAHSLSPYGEGNYGFAHTQRSSSVLCHRDKLSSEVKTLLCADCSAELRLISLTVNDSGRFETGFIAAMRPVLAFENDYVNHPAFFGFGLHAKPIPGGVLIRRLRRNELDECWLCIKCSRELDADFSENSMSCRPEYKKQSSGWLVRPQLRLAGKIELTGGKTTEIRLALGFGNTEQKAIECCDRAMSLNETNSAALPELSSSLLGMSVDEVEKAVKLLPHIFMPKAKNAGKLAATEGRHGLWGAGISGDYPVILINAEAASSNSVTESVIKRCAYLHSCSVRFDLAIIVNDAGDYQRKNAGIIGDILNKFGVESRLGACCGFHIVDSTKDLTPLVGSSAIILDQNGEIIDQDVSCVDDNYFMSTIFPLYTTDKMPKTDYLKDMGFEFYINYFLPPRAWTNMLTNGRFGYLASDCGTGFMWMENARENPITPWLNDPIASQGHEMLFIESSGIYRSIFADENGETRVRYYPGVSVWNSILPTNNVRMTAFIPQDTDARVLLIEADNEAVLHWTCPLSLCGNKNDRPFVITDFADNTFSARNMRADNSLNFYALSSRNPLGFTCDYGSSLHKNYDSRSGAGLDPCFAAKYSVIGTLVLVCGCDDPEKLRSLANPEAARAALSQTRKLWMKRSSRLTIKTPYPELDRAVSTWLHYQTLACRIMGRTSIYQSGGAIGFRDQLQDVTALISTQPQICREHILVSAAHQYEQGDVQHWWHPSLNGDRGVRTHCSDDLLWLPWAVCEYVEKTGDRGILNQNIPYLTSPILGGNERDRYEQPPVTDYSETIAAHCNKALDLVLSRGTGPHSLFRIGSGDWNDGFDKIGGESVWLTWFYAHTARRYANLMGVEKYLTASENASIAADSTWDIDHWLRGYFENGEPLGSSGSVCCEIDSIAQSFASLVNAVNPSRLDTALNTALAKLHDSKVIKLFTPAFEEFLPDPGYIQSYGPGFRENGGQYTHGAVWLAMACLKTGKRAEGLQLLLDLLPEGHDGLNYGGEPFVLPADVCTNSDHFGEAGWTWYTGSAGWYLRVATEELLGIIPENGRLSIYPKNTPGLESFSFIWRSSQEEEYTVCVENGNITVNGTLYNGKGLPL